MRKIKSIFESFYRQAINYNLFISDENDYDEEPRDPATVVKYQKYATRLYVLLLLVCMYVVFYATLMNVQARTIVVNDIDSDKFEKLYSEHNDTLSCPCSTIAISYQQFVSNTIRFHPVCSSFFVSQQWIEALYLSDGSLYAIGDFRRTASSQFQLLSSLCSLYQEVTLKSEADLNNNQFITASLLPLSKIEFEVNATVQSFKSSLSTRILSFIDYFRIITQTNGFITALGTNAVIYHAVDGNVESLFSESTFHMKLVNVTSLVYLFCRVDNVISSTRFDQQRLDPTTVDNLVAFAMWFDVPFYPNIVKGFFIGCFPFESLLQATLDCLYEIECLQLLNDNFPSLNETNLNISDYVLRSNKSNLTIYNYLSNLLIDEWTTTLNYSGYFQGCNPSTCTYTTTDTINYSFAIALFISLYGGLVLILRSFSFFLINILSIFKCRSTNRIGLQQLFQWIKQLNLFKVADQRTENAIKQQKVTTHIYLILLLISITVLILFNSLDTQTVTTSVSNPSLNTYINLQNKYPNTLTCPCSTVTIPYDKFLSLSPVLHQICSSDLITDNWISSLEKCVTEYVDVDWRNRAYRQFILLSKFCQLANETVTTSVNEFLSQSFVSSNALTKDDFNLQIEKLLSQFYESTIGYFRHLIDVVNLHIQVDQPFMLNFAATTTQVSFYSIQPIEKNTTNNDLLVEVTLSLTSLEDINSTSGKCYCSTDYNCQISSQIFNFDFTFTESSVVFSEDSVAYVVPGSILGCSEMNSLLLSTLECFYSDSSCFNIVRNYLQQMYVWSYTDLSSPFLPLNVTLTWFNAKPLVYNSTSTNFYRNSSISTIIENLFIEEWNAFYSYNEFYQLCSPSSCMYQERLRINSTSQIIVIFISMIGGLIISIRLITLYLVNFIMKLISILTRKQQQASINRKSWSEQLKLIKKDMIRSLYNILINLNIFPRHSFRNDIDQITVKYYGQLATRLYFLLLIVSLVILTLYTAIQQRIWIEEFNDPSFETYNKLVEKYGDQLKCPCSSISSTYGQFVEIEPIFHEICSSSFASYEMVKNLAGSLSSDLLIYEKRDYRRFISSHIQYLQGLCQISIESVNSSIENFFLTLLISRDLLFEDDFNERLNVLIEQAKQDALTNLNIIFFLIRNLNFGNGIVSAYETNFKYVGNWEMGVTSVFIAEPEIYDNDCLCALHINCTSQAYFIEMNSSENIPIQGLKIGCTPIEALLSSTLECFYNNSCVNTIKEYTNYTYSLESLSNQSQINLTINELVQNLFIDQWISKTNYSSYYQQCLPRLCSYTYLERVNLIYLISFLLGFQGGLSIVFKWICPKLVQLILTIKRNRRNRTNIVHPAHPHVVIQTATTNELQSNVMSHLLIKFAKLILSCLLIMILIVFLTIFSIYLVHHINHPTTYVTVSSTNPTMDTNVTALSTLTLSSIKPCHFKFERISITMPESYISSEPTVVGDFNNDNVVDIAYVPLASTSSEVIVLLGNENGTFGEPIISTIGLSFPFVYSYTVADFDHDSLLDIIAVTIGILNICILIGNGDGTFHDIMLLIENCSAVGQTPSVGNLNNDKFLDFAFICIYPISLNIIFGNANGTFAQNIVYNNLIETNLYLITSLNIADMNGDNYGDLVVTNMAYGGISVYLGYGNGSFHTQKFSLAGARISIQSIFIGDFNKDSKLDVIALQGSQLVESYLMFGYNDGTFDVPINFILNCDFSDKLAASDFNGDGFLDLMSITSSPYTVNVYYGDGNGNFELYKIDSEAQNMAMSFADVDFNGDGYQDIFIVTLLGVYVYLNTHQCYNGSQIVGTNTSTNEYY